MSSARVVTIHYTLTDDAGAVIDSSQGSEPLEYLEGAGNIIPGLEKAVSAMAQGEKKKVSIAPAEGYGEAREDLIIEVPRTQFPKDMSPKVGDRFRGGPDQHSPVFTVLAVGLEKIRLDGNHPLAGKTLHFEVELLQLRAATAEELSHGHAHGPDGHHHH